MAWCKVITIEDISELLLLLEMEMEIIQFEPKVAEARTQAKAEAKAGREGKQSCRERKPVIHGDNPQ